MIFKPELVRAIQQGKKTMTRRPCKPGEKACFYQPGKVYTVKPGRTKPAALHITITEVRPEWVGCITLEDARREGFRTTAEFLAYWHRLYGPPATAGVRRMERERAELEEEGLIESNIEVSALTASIDESRELRAERLPLPAVPCLVWVISFVKGDCRDVPRLLRSGAPQAPVCKAPLRRPDGKLVYKPGSKKIAVPCNRAFREDQEVCQCGAPRPPETGEDHGYTARDANKMSNEPEAVSAAEQEQLAKAARDGETQLSLRPVRERRERLEAEARALRRDLTASAGPVHRDVSKQLDRIERALEQLDDLLSHAA